MKYGQYPLSRTSTGPIKKFTKVDVQDLGFLSS